jgi:hypothetical protein
MELSTEQMIEVMQAYLDGEDIEIRLPQGNWIQVYGPSWNWDNNDYRVKAKPKKLYAFVESRGRVIHKIDTDSPGIAFKRAEQFDITFEE